VQKECSRKKRRTKIKIKNGKKRTMMNEQQLGRNVTSFWHNSARSILTTFFLVAIKRDFMSQPSQIRFKGK